MKILVLQDIKHITYQNFKENFRLLLYVLVILYLPRMVLHECKSSRDKNKTSARQTSLTDRQRKVHLIHTSIETQTSKSFSHLVLVHFALRLLFNCIS